MLEGERQAMLAAADVHWWYRGRRRIIEAQLGLLHLRPGSHLLDAGCGGGQTLDLLAEYGVAIGIDPDPGSVALARRRGHEAVAAGLPDLPFEDGSFAAATCLDVIEHLDDDCAALRELARVVEPGGALLVTVPAYEALWSQHDVVNQHVRRYRARTLQSVAVRGGWDIERLTYFNSLLLPPAAVMRLAERLRPRRPSHGSDLARTPRRLNRALELPLRAEAGLLRRGGRLPAGLSVLAVLRRA